MANRRISAFTTTRSTGTDAETPARPRSSDEKKEIWSSLLDSVSSGKRLPEKSVLVLGGSPETQKDFLESLNTDPHNKRRPQDRQNPPVANQFALGYTYQDVLDDDHEDTLARLSLYLLTDPSPSFTPLLKPLLTPRTLPHMLLVILLDWNEPWSWLRQLRDWVRVFRGLLVSLDNDCKDALEENIMLLQRGRGGVDSGDAGEQIPLGPGEWDEPLGIPLCVVCQNADKIEQLERERGWKEDDFDFILECLRTVLLKHGASLVYTMPSRPGSLQSLVHASLGIQASLKRQSLKYNVTDRDSVLIPPNWDSWGKIRTLREGFDIEGMSKFWSLDIQNGQADSENTSAVGIYEETVEDPNTIGRAISGLGSAKEHGIEVDSMDNQTFLTTQQEILDKLRAEDEENKAKDREAKRGRAIVYNEPASNVVTDQIGPVQFNMGGIQVDADDILTKINARENERAASPTKASLDHTNGTPTSPGAQEESNERLKSFFAGLMNRK